MGLLTSLITEHMRGKREKEDAAQKAYLTILGNDQLPDELHEWAVKGLKGEKPLKEMGPTVDAIHGLRGLMRKSGGPVSATTPAGDGGGIDAAKQRSVDMSQGPPQVAPMPGMGPMDVA